MSAIEVDVARLPSGTLTLTYALAGELSALRIPPPAASSRTDELWKHTCFEAFIRAGTSDAYAEFNFAPSTQWAAYTFSGYRTGMTVAAGVYAPRIEVTTRPKALHLAVALDLVRTDVLPADGIWHLGLSAVIEETNGHKSYWALAHPAGKPDFHHSESFALDLPRAW